MRLFQNDCHINGSFFQSFNSNLTKIMDFSSTATFGGRALSFIHPLSAGTFLISIILEMEMSGKFMRVWRTTSGPNVNDITSMILFTTFFFVSFEKKIYCLILKSRACLS